MCRLSPMEPQTKFQELFLGGSLRRLHRNCFRYRDLKFLSYCNYVQKIRNLQKELTLAKNFIDAVSASLGSQ